MVLQQGFQSVRRAELKTVGDYGVGVGFDDVVEGAVVGGEDVGVVLGGI